MEKAPYVHTIELDADIVERISKDNGHGPEYLDNLLKIYSDAIAVLLKKSADYGPTNIANSPGGPLNGLRVRMWDKTARLNNLIDQGVDPENEPLADTFLDLLNYSAIAQMVLKGQWPGVKD